MRSRKSRTLATPKDQSKAWNIGSSLAESPKKAHSERLASVLNSLGYSKTDNEDEASIIVVIACSVKQSAVNRIDGKLRNWQLKKEKESLITILAGCVLEEDRKKLKPKFDLFIDIKNLDNLATEINKIKPEEKLALPSFFDIKPSYGSEYKAYIPIMTGCNKFCTYCAVPYTRGREVSRPAADIINPLAAASPPEPLLTVAPSTLNCIPPIS